MSKTKMKSQLDRENEVYRIASELFATNPSWIVFLREIFGLEGVVRHLFPDREEMEVFEKTQKFLEIRSMLATLRKQRDSPQDPSEPSKIITVRIPKSLHEILMTEAKERHTSMNKWCIAKLLQIAEEDEFSESNDEEEGR